MFTENGITPEKRQVHNVSESCGDHVDDRRYGHTRTRTRTHPSTHETHIILTNISCCTEFPDGGVNHSESASPSNSGTEERNRRAVSRDCIPRGRSHSRNIPAVQNNGLLSLRFVFLVTTTHLIHEGQQVGRALGHATKNARFNCLIN